MFVNLLRRFLIMAVLVPLVAAGARKLGEVVEARRGPSRGTRLLRQGAETLQGFGRPRKRRRYGSGR